LKISSSRFRSSDNCSSSIAKDEKEVTANFNISVAKKAFLFLSSDGKNSSRTPLATINVIGLCVVSIVPLIC